MGPSWRPQQPSSLGSTATGWGPGCEMQREHQQLFCTRALMATRLLLLKQSQRACARLVLVSKVSTVSSPPARRSLRQSRKRMDLLSEVQRWVVTCQHQFKRRWGQSWRSHQRERSPVACLEALGGPAKLWMRSRNDSLMPVIRSRLMPSAVSLSPQTRPFKSAKSLAPILAKLLERIEQRRTVSWRRAPFSRPRQTQRLRQWVGLLELYA
mmetsp:Transcript_1154/g.4051  ORF Transcript_1154/g.4051 Transcript_1154/m.4051 type:complete len:211 (+) Transcript_1154:1197-1829(+)